LNYEAAKNHGHALRDDPDDRNALDERVEGQEQAQPAQLQKYLEEE
jgi:hypothetical protein